jgi:hypothetical protein
LQVAQKYCLLLFSPPPKAAILSIQKGSITSLLHQLKIPPKKSHSWQHSWQHSFLLAKLCREEKFKNQKV